MFFREVAVVKASGGALTPKDYAAIAQRAVRFVSEITIEMGSLKINAKSIMGLLSLSLKDSSKLVVIAKGSDEEEAVTDIERVLKSGF